MLTMSLWVQDKIAELEPLSSALFCLLLSTASLVPSFLLGVV